MEAKFKPMFCQIYKASDETKKRNIIDKQWSQLDSANFFHIVALTDAEKLKQWINDIVDPYERKNQEKGKV